LSPLIAPGAGDRDEVRSQGAAELLFRGADRRNGQDAVHRELAERRGEVEALGVQVPAELFSFNFTSVWLAYPFFANG